MPLKTNNRPPTPSESARSAGAARPKRPAKRSRSGESRSPRKGESVSSEPSTPPSGEAKGTKHRGTAQTAQALLMPQMAPKLDLPLGSTGGAWEQAGQWLSEKIGRGVDKFLRYASAGDDADSNSGAAGGGETEDFATKPSKQNSSDSTTPESMRFMQEKLLHRAEIRLGQTVPEDIKRKIQDIVEKVYPTLLPLSASEREKEAARLELAVTEMGRNALHTGTFGPEQMGEMLDGQLNSMFPAFNRLDLNLKDIVKRHLVGPFIDFRDALMAIHQVSAQEVTEHRDRLTRFANELVSLASAGQYDLGSNVEVASRLDLIRNVGDEAERLAQAYKAASKKQV